MSVSPGPWKRYRGKRKHQEAIFIKAKSGRGEFVAKVYGHDGQPVVENAKLIRAAPALVQACIKVLPYIATGSDEAEEAFSVVIDAIFEAGFESEVGP